MLNIGPENPISSHLRASKPHTVLSNLFQDKIVVLFNANHSKRGMLTHIEVQHFRTSMVIVTHSNDVNPNPGPEQSIYPCGICNQPVTWANKGIMCDICNQWYSTMQTINLCIVKHITNWQMIVPEYRTALFVIAPIIVQYIIML